MAFTPQQDRDGLPRKLEELKRALHSTLLMKGWDLLNVTVFNHMGTERHWDMFPILMLMGEPG